MTSACRIFCRNLNTPFPKIISTKLRMSSMKFTRYCSGSEQQNSNTLKHGALAEFYEKTKERHQVEEEDQDFEVLLRNSNFINVWSFEIKYLYFLNVD